MYILSSPVILGNFNMWRLLSQSKLISIFELLDCIQSTLQPLWQANCHHVYNTDMLVVGPIKHNFWNLFNFHQFYSVLTYGFSWFRTKISALLTLKTVLTHHYRKFISVTMPVMMTYEQFGLKSYFTALSTYESWCHIGYFTAL